MSKRLVGLERLNDWFGPSFSFHDAEIVQVVLNRKGESLVILHAWRMTDQSDAQGHIVLDQFARVILHLDEVVGRSVA
jgi:hypothetical protein